jgi:hypothetical protein
MTAGCTTTGYCSVQFPGFSPGRYYQVTNRLTSVLLAEPTQGPRPGTSSTNLWQKFRSMNIIAQDVSRAKNSLRCSR